MEDDHLRQVHSALSDFALAGDGSRQSASKRSADAAAARNAARLSERLRTMASTLPFRKDDRSREQIIGDLWRLSRLAGRPLSARPGRLPGSAPVPADEPSICDPGWSGVIKPGDSQFSSDSTLVERPALETQPPALHVGYSGTSARAFANNGQFTVGAVIGEYCGLEWTPPDQRITMGLFEGATISASLSTFFDLGASLRTRAPNALMVKTTVSRTAADTYMVAGSPDEQGGGLIWCWALMYTWV
jgi:hypothetical protein